MAYGLKVSSCHPLKEQNPQNQIKHDMCVMYVPTLQRQLVSGLYSSNVTIMKTLYRGTSWYIDLSITASNVNVKHYIKFTTYKITHDVIRTSLHLVSDL